MQVFTIYSNDIKNRIDPLYYSSATFDTIRKLNFETKKITEVVLYFKTGFAAGKQDQDETQKGIIQIRPTNIDFEENLIFDKNVYISTESKKINTDLLQKGEVLFNNTNSQELVGKTAYFDLEGEYFCSNHITRIGVDKDIILPVYFQIVLNLYQRRKVFFNICTNWNNQSGVNINLLKTLDIPVPEISIQEEIISLLNTASYIKQQKEKEAQEILNSIDEYILSELGIKMREQKTNMTFIVNSEDIKGTRIDPFFCQSISSEQITSKYPIVEFKNLILSITKGETPLWKGDSYQKVGTPFLKVQNIAPGKIKDISTYISEEVHKRMKRSQLFGGELLYSMAGSIGIAAIFPKGLGEANINQAIAKILLKPEINGQYIEKVLNSTYCKYQLKQLVTTSAQPNINFEQIKSIKIPLPMQEIQQIIAQEIEKRLEQSEELQRQAFEVITQAREKIEMMLLATN